MLGTTTPQLFQYSSIAIFNVITWNLKTAINIHASQIYLTDISESLVQIRRVRGGFTP